MPAGDRIQQSDHGRVRLRPEPRGDVPHRPIKGAVQHVPGEEICAAASLLAFHAEGPSLSAAPVPATTLRILTEAVGRVHTWVSFVRVFWQRSLTVETA